MNGLVLAGTRSGVGKTVATLATISALEDAGFELQPAKAGPDFIDPSHHRAVADRPSRTLDVWLQGQDGIQRNYHRGSGDVCLVEGVMGLYDGDGSSTAMVAESLDLPVVLVVDAKAGMESVAATALGFKTYADRIGRDIDVPGVLVQRAHGGRHEEGIRDALPDDLTYFGRIPPQSDLEIPERHLGLHMGDETTLPRDALDAAAESIRTERLLEVASEPPSPPEHNKSQKTGEQPQIAVARDEAFSFLYPRTLERLRERATVELVSPLAGDELPPVDGVYLPGGYPELHAERLSNSSTLETLAEKASDGLPIFGECGGFMALCQSLTTADGTTVDLPGVLPATVEMHDRYQALDHVELSPTGQSPLAETAKQIRGHEFHYSSTSLTRDAQFAFEVERGDGIDGAHEGLVEYNAVGTYTHFHAESGIFDSFLDSFEP